ncbi:hypothetical protein, partial [Aerococcus tenax]|uniref:hypothetical protein n=1 Tax=Aerococcus tenax TaxID=3078812 RepID=UPI001E6386E2
QNVLRVQIDLHFTKVQEILFKNFCSLAPVLSIFDAPVALFSRVRTPALKSLQKIPTHSLPALMVFSSSDSSL